MYDLKKPQLRFSKRFETIDCLNLVFFATSYKKIYNKLFDISEKHIIDIKHVIIEVYNKL